MKGDLVQDELRGNAERGRQAMRDYPAPNASELIVRTGRVPLVPFPRIAAALAVIGTAALSFFAIERAEPAPVNVPDSVTALVNDLYGESSDGTYVAIRISPMFLPENNGADAFLSSVWDEVSDP